MNIIRCSVTSDVEKEFNEEKALENERMIMTGEKKAIIIESTALKSILSDDNFANKRWFIKIARTAETVICCRVSPSQKAEVVKLIRSDDPEAVTLAIGDGANDVSMILEADIGVGIFGNEGMRAVASSDFAIVEFKHLRQLLFKHGRWNYIRMSELINYFFYKNYVYVFLQILFSINNGFSSQTIIADWLLTFYNMVFTALPCGIKAI
jgi:magnesium-transporting ATPase (P-type)